MSDRVFYAGSEKDGRLTGYVPAKFLTVNGRPVVDPKGSQNAFIYADGSDKYKTRGEIANPSNYLIVPANYTGEQAGTFAAEIAKRVAQGSVGRIQALRRMDESFSQNGPQDLQRHPQWGIPEGSVVPAFVSSASYHLGSVTRQADVPMILSEIGGGMANLGNRYIKQPLNYLLGKKWNSIDTNGPRFLSQQNHANFSKGYSDADAAGARAPVNSHFGYNPQAQYSAGQIGDGNGLGVGDWRFAFAGVDPVNPTRPVPPPRTDSKLVPRLVQVSGNNSPAAAMGSVK